MSFRPRKFRSKASDSEPAEAGVDADAGSAADPKASSAPRQAVPKSKPSLLSFDDDAEGDGGPLAMAGRKKEREKDKGKKGVATSSKFGRAQELPDLPSSAAAFSQRSSTGEYSSDRLKDLERHALKLPSDLITKDVPTAGAVPAAPAAPAAAAAAAAASADHSIIKLSGSFKAKVATTDGRFQIDSNGLVKHAPVQYSMPLPPPARPRGVDTQPSRSHPSATSTSNSKQPASTATAAHASVAAAGGGGDDSDDDSDGIPDEKMIMLAKAKRERLRQAHLAPDYIPLGGAAKLVGDYKEARSARPRSAAVGEGGGGGEEKGGMGGAGEGDDGDVSDDDLEDHMRIKFGNNKGGRNRDGYAKSIADEDVFAEEQMRKAVRAQGMGAQPQPQGFQQPQQQMWWGVEAGGVPVSVVGQQQQQQQYSGSTGAGGFSVSAGVGGAASRAHMDQIGSAGAAALTSLQEGLKRLQTSSKSCQANLTRTSDNLTSSLSKIESLESEIKGASEKYVFVQKSKAYIADLCDCLAEKSLIVEELEDSLMELREDRAAAGKDALKVLEDEMMKGAEAGVAAATAVMSRSGASTAASIAAERAIDDFEDDLACSSSGVELDEFGRNVNMQQQREAEERCRRRAALVQADRSLIQEMAAGSIISLPVEDVAAGEAGGEDSSETRRYEARHAEIMETAATVFADADEEYATLSAVKQRLEELKFSYPKQYASMYMHLTTPALFAPHVRLQLLTWDPLYADSAAHGVMATSREGVHKGFDQQDWYDSLFDYGVGSDAAADDPDNELVPQLVRKLVLPLAQHMLERCWDPSNMRSSRAAAALCGDLCVYVAAEEESMKDMLDGVAAALERAVAACSIPTWSPSLASLVPVAEAVQLRRFRHAVRVLHGISFFEGLLSRHLLLPLSLTKLVSHHCLPYMRSSSGALQGAVARLEALVSALPGEWFTGGPPTEAAPLCEHTASLCRALEMQRHDGGKAMMAARLVAVAMKVGESERAARLASAFALKL